ncbi:MAG TPA: tetratricopeptide repeat protein, partial [Thermoanaerobaculia bacterium]|nr:tetratricopeptide repeat protein [Thermoanaerobaculia bacterium]
IASRAAEELGVNLAETQRKQLADKPTQNLAAYDAFLKGEAASGGGIRSDAPSIRKALDLYEQAVALDPRFALAWARIAEQNSIRYFNFSPTPEVAERAREAAEKAVALAPNLPDGYYALGRYYRTVQKDARRSLDEFLKGQKLFPGNSDFLRGISLADQVLGRWQEALENSRKAMRLDPRDVSNIGNLGDVLLRLHRWSESREAFDRALAISPDNLFLIERKAMSFLGEGDLPAARALLKQARSVEPTALVAYVASFQDLGWVLDAEQAALLKRLTPAAFDGDEATWAICLAQACSFAGDSVCVRGFAERARKAFETQLSSSPGDVNLMTGHAIALAYLGLKEDAIHEVENASALWPVAADAQVGPYVRHQLARVAILTGDYEKALDVLEPLLRLPYFLSPGWLKVDPNFDALRGNPRFQKLAAGAGK